MNKNLNWYFTEILLLPGHVGTVVAVVGIVVDSGTQTGQHLPEILAATNPVAHPIVPHVID